MQVKNTMSLLQRCTAQNLFRASSRAFSNNSVTYEIKDLVKDPNQKGQDIFSLYRLEQDQMPTTATTTKDELMAYLNRMIVMRRTELEADRLYKAKKIRGFCHLYDGQEAISEGMEAAMTYDDAIITAYRDHTLAIARGDTPYRIIAEMC